MQISRSYLGICLIALLVLPVLSFVLIKRSDADAFDVLYEDSNFLTVSLANELESELQKFSLIPLLISEYPDTAQALEGESSETVERLNNQLEFLSDSTGAAYIFVFDENGNTIASSNFNSPGSFIGENFKFRPYFKETIEKGSSRVFAVGAETGTPGLFLTKRLGEAGDAKGGIVVKVEFHDIIDGWQKTTHSLFVKNSDGIILFSNDEDLNYKTLEDISREKELELQSSRQFGSIKIESANMIIGPNRTGIDQDGQDVLINSIPVGNFDWTMIRALPFKDEIAAQRSGAYLISLLMATAIGMLLWFWRRRIIRDLEKAKNTEFLKTEVKRQTKEISDAKDKLQKEMDARELFNRRFRLAREELAQANRLGSIGAITASVAHEINQPVAAIQTFAENADIFIERGRPDKAKENLTAIVELTSKIGLITNQLRRYSRKRSHGLDDVSLENVFKGVELLIGDRLKSAGVIFSRQPTDLAEFKVRAGRVRLEQVFVNLFQNAMDAMDHVENPRIDILVLETHDKVHIAVSDNGSGIKEDIRHKVFDPFFTERAEGLGMGLGIVKEIVSEFGGDIRIKNSSSDGTTFELVLVKS